MLATCRRRGAQLGDGRRSSGWRATGAATRRARVRSPRSCGRTAASTRRGRSPRARRAARWISWRGTRCSTARRCSGRCMRRWSALLDPARQARAHEPPVSGRYVRIVLPGRDRSLSLAEVQVFSGSDNVAPKGAATQSSTVAGGAIGGHAPRANDGRLEIDGGRESDPASGTVSFTSPEQDPWWELDLGDVRPIETIAIWNGRAGGRTDLLHVSVLDADRQPVFVAGAVAASTATETRHAGRRFHGRACRIPRIAALPAIPRSRCRERSPSSRASSRAAPDAAGRHCRTAPDSESGLAETAAPGARRPISWSYLRAVPAGERTGARVRAGAPVDEGRRRRAAFSPEQQASRARSTRSPSERSGSRPSWRR